MTIACYDQDKIIKYNGLIILLAQPKNKTMFLPRSQAHTQTHTQHLYILLSNFLSFSIANHFGLYSLLFNFSHFYI